VIAGKEGKLSCYDWREYGGSILPCMGVGKVGGIEG